MKRKESLQVIRENVGRVRGQELIDLINDHYSDGWGARFLAHDRLSEAGISVHQALQSPNLDHLHDTALAGLATNIED